MSHCLSDPALAALDEGGGTAAERAHLAACVACTRRARQLTRDVALLARILGDPPPADVLVAPPRTAQLGWVAAAAVLIAALAIGWDVSLRRPSSVAMAASDLSVLEDLSGAVFDAGGEEALLVRPGEGDVLADTVDDPPACEFAPGGCADSLP